MNRKEYEELEGYHIREDKESLIGEAFTVDSSMAECWCECGEVFYYKGEPYLYTGDKVSRMFADKHPPVKNKIQLEGHKDENLQMR